MKEININIEGYNESGICVGCLNYNRTMFYDKNVKECFKMLADIEVPDGLSIRVCWECHAYIQSVMKFREKVLRSYKVLSEYSETHTFLNSPEDLSKHATQRLSSHIYLDDVEIKVENTPDVEVIKEEVSECTDKIEIEIPDIEVKTEDEHIEEDISMDYYEEIQRDSESDDIALSKLKTEKDVQKKKKKKKKDRQRSKDDVKKEMKDRKNRRLLNLPEKLVELYTMSEEEMWSVRERDVSSEEFQKLKYRCDLCIISFNTKKLKEFHDNGKHFSKTDNDYTCDVCKAHFLAKENIKFHRKLHLSAFKCRECNLITTLKRIMLGHDCAKKVPAYTCPDCPDKKFSTRSKLSYHRTVSHQEKPQCDCCGKIFANKITLKYHLKLLPNNKDEKPKENLFIPCKGCNKVFHSKKSYRAHAVIHEGVSYPCPICGKLFQWKRNLARHTRNHRERENGALYQCRECGKSFSSRDCFNNHMKLSKKHVHEDSYIHICNFCGKKFATKWCMIDHIDWDHLKRIKYQCSVCFKAFKTAKIMVAHMNNIHEGKNKKEPDGEHLCEICGKSYKTVKRLKGHVWAMHTKRSNTKSFKCSLCPATFSWQTSIYKHMKMMHFSKRAKQTRVQVKKPEPYTHVEVNRIQYFPPMPNTLQTPPINPLININITDID
ncbi:unnamed protein product, partial [Brenthis ino]